MSVGAIWGFGVPPATPGCREWGHFGGGSAVGPPAPLAPTPPLSAAALLANRLYPRWAFPNISEMSLAAL